RDDTAGTNRGVCVGCGWSGTLGGGSRSRWVTTSWRAGIWWVGPDARGGVGVVLPQVVGAEFGAAGAGSGVTVCAQPAVGNA
ncbi:MAG: hypothetical protein NZ483_09710, partial [Verrucomicrobiae bacterium]|nr:hypothetical protein [Verrucomicrobiae bacterium]